MYETIFYENASTSTKHESQQVYKKVWSRQNRNLIIVYSSWQVIQEVTSLRKKCSPLSDRSIKYFSAHRPLPARPVFPPSLQLWLSSNLNWVESARSYNWIKKFIGNFGPRSPRRRRYFHLMKFAELRSSGHSAGCASFSAPHRFGTRDYYFSTRARASVNFARCRFTCPARICIM